jgi:uncharacterized protein (TIGR02145 family)
MFFLKNYHFHKPKKLIHLFVLLILLAYCTKERNNPWDDKNTLKKDSWMVDNLTIDIFKIDSINLAWELKNDKIEGVRIDRKIDEQPWVSNYAQVPNNILNFTDTAVNLLNHKYHYRLYAYAGNNLSSFLDTIVPKLNLPTINTTSIKSLTSTSAVSGGNVTSDGGSTITQRGVCWSITPNPTISNDKTTNGEGKGSFISNLTVLSAGTKYYVRAYATNIAGTSYGNEVSFTTGQILPVLTTNLITSIMSSSAVSGGNIINIGEDTLIQIGVCWSTSPNPTITNNKTIDGLGNVNFISYLNDLSAGTKYYVRAYATNSKGTSYGNEVSFTTLQILPVLTTNPITSITSVSAVSGGDISNDGGGTITQRGVCWSTSSNPTMSNDKTINGSGVGSYTSSLSGLTAGTTYYLRAYAVNSVGTSYGNEVSFTTEQILPILTTNSITFITSSSAISGGDISNDGGGTITQKGVCWSTNPNPTILNDKTINGSGVGSYTSNLSGLSAGTTYYLRAYAINSVGTSYGNEVSFTTEQILPILTTNSITSITSSSAISGGDISNDGGGTITQKGVCWSTNPNPTILNDKTTDGSGEGSFTSNLVGLSTGTTYYIRAYATNSLGTSYGNELIFRSLGALYGNGVTDINGNSYQTIIIGNQEWMAQNLNVSKYNNGTNIPNVTGNNEWASLSTGAWSYYDNDNQYEANYGKLYNWYAVNTSKLCPTGWHVPSDAEWTILMNYLGANGHNGTQGKALKATSTWASTGNGTDNFGWKGRYGGIRINDGVFSNVGTSGEWWSTSETSTNGALKRAFYNSSDSIFANTTYKRAGFSVRCLKD